MTRKKKARGGFRMCGCFSKIDEPVEIEISTHQVMRAPSMVEKMPPMPSPTELKKLFAEFVVSVHYYMGQSGQGST